MKPIAAQVFKLTPNELRKELNKYFKNQYGYQPEFELYYDTQSIYPVHFSLIEENSDEFRHFRLSLLRDLFSIGVDVDDGHNLLRLLFQKEINECTFYPHEAKYVEYAYEDDVSMLIFTSDKEVNKVNQEDVEKKVKEMENRINRFIFTEEEFQLFTSKSTLFKKMNVWNDENILWLTYSFEENEINYRFDLDEEASLSCISYAHSDEMIKESEQILNQLVLYFSNRFDLAQNGIKVEKKCVFRPCETSLHRKLNNFRKCRHLTI